MQILSYFQHFWANPTRNYSVFTLISLIGVTIPAWILQDFKIIIPMILGVIAAALTESDDSFTGKLKSQSLSLLCFAIATFSIEVLFEFPIAFAIGLFCSTISLVMLGAIGQRYAKIAFGTLMMAIYTMLGAQESTNLWYQPLLLLLGSAWHFMLCIIWYAIKPMHSVQQNLSTIFNELSRYFEAKKLLFRPVSDLQPQAHRINEASLNSKTVEALNKTKASFIARSKRGQVYSSSDRYLKVYFLAQDIHERISSSHYRYQDLSKAFKHSDILFRFKYLVETQAESCKNIANAIRLGCAYVHNSESKIALKDLKDSIHYIEEHASTEQKSLIGQLKYLLVNLETIEEQLASVSNPDALSSKEDKVLTDTEVHTLSGMWQRVKANLTPSSMIFRHAIRLSTALTCGYGIIQLFDIEQGYWILLTTLFVCQTNYSATKKKLRSRLIGTISGLCIGIFLLFIFPSITSQIFFIILSGVAFFTFKENNYSYATTFITILVLFGFNQLGDGYAVILPRLFDTLVGCGLAVLAVTFILPDWQSKSLYKIMADSVNANKKYLALIISQYSLGKKNDIQYRIARRDSHNQEAQLNSAINNMLMEPGRYQTATDVNFRFLTLNHAVLSYISALGSHRNKIDNSDTQQLISNAYNEIENHLEALIKQLNSDVELPYTPIDIHSIEEQYTQWREKEDEPAKMVLLQLYLIYKMLPELHELTKELAMKAKNVHEAERIFR